MSAGIEHQVSIDSVIESVWPGVTAASYEVVQGLWSDYGAIVRVKLNTSLHADTAATAPLTVVAKVVAPPQEPNHPRGWNTDVSKQRKLRSYQVERSFYENYAQQCSQACTVPRCHGSQRDGNSVTLVLDDLDQEFPVRLTQCSPNSAKPCLVWLAAFHARFLGTNDSSLWDRGTYWHLGTRHDEFNAMADGPLKFAAHKLDKALRECEHQTLLHGDAKVANFCFNSAGNRVAAVDFQYTGRGCGMQDVAYFLGSCLHESELFDQEAHLLDTYFQALAAELAIAQPSVNTQRLEAEWRRLYSVAGADFHRFLSGWSPDHWKLTAYSDSLVTRALHITTNLS